jgi:hypothetical protein
MEERLRLLRLWEHDRKRAQWRIHYRYDPNRRNPARLERDVAKMLERLEKRRAKVEAFRLPQRPNVPRKLSTPAAAAPGAPHDEAQQVPFQRGSGGARFEIPLAALAELRRKTGIANLGTPDQTATPEEIIAALKANHVPPEEALALLDAIQPRRA